MIKEIQEVFSKIEIRDLDTIHFKKMQEKYKKKLTSYDYVALSRHEKRPKSLDFINALIDSPVFLKGDRLYGEDPALIGGIGYFNDIPVTFLGTNKGKNLNENLEYNFGMLNPEGYRKSLRLMKQAEKFNRPILTFIDTPGAYPGIGAEERGQGEAIAKNIMEMGSLKVPIIAIFTGEGGSGGALALSIANKIIMMEFSIFSILSPEGFATILWKDGSKHKEAAEVMKLRSKDLLKYNIIDEIVKEDIVFGTSMYGNNFKRLKKSIDKELNKLMKLNTEELVDKRYKKFMEIGGF